MKIFEPEIEINYTDTKNSGTKFISKSDIEMNLSNLNDKNDTDYSYSFNTI